MLPPLGSASLGSSPFLRSFLRIESLTLARDALQLGSFLLLRTFATGSKLPILDLSYLGLVSLARSMTQIGFSSFALGGSYIEALLFPLGAINCGLFSSLHGTSRLDIDFSAGSCELRKFTVRTL